VQSEQVSLPRAQFLRRNRRRSRSPFDQSCVHVRETFNVNCNETYVPAEALKLIPVEVNSYCRVASLISGRLTVKYMTFYGIVECGDLI